jgi:hypothetical protein
MATMAVAITQVSAIMAVATTPAAATARVIDNAISITEHCFPPLWKMR